MALPADFSKIYGSTATGGLTPISNVNYAKGWEFVGSNPPTKNDFSYLQNQSDLKAQWLYSNKLNLANPLSEIASAGTQSTARTNIGLGTAATMDVGNGTNKIPDMSFFAWGSGYQKLPSTYIIQWGAAVAGASGTAGTANTFPIPFPNASIVVVAGQVDSVFSAGSAVNVVGVASLTATGFTAKGNFTSGSDSFHYLAIGY